MATNQAGQSLLEFLLSLPTVILTLVAGGYLLHVEWERDRCAYIVFQAAHRALRAEPSFDPKVEVRISDTGAVADGQCDGAHERVALPELEKAIW